MVTLIWRLLKQYGASFARLSVHVEFPHCCPTFMAGRAQCQFILSAIS